MLTSITAWKATRTIQKIAIGVGIDKLDLECLQINEGSIRGKCSVSLHIRQAFQLYICLVVFEYKQAYTCKNLLEQTVHLHEITYSEELLLLS